jgi:hypothetical protein
MGKARIHRWQRRKRAVGLGLIPVGDGIIIVPTIVGMAVFDGGAKRFGESDRGVEMETIERPT